MKQLFLSILLTTTVLFSFSQKKVGLIEYAANTTVGIRVEGKETINATGFFFVFNTDKGLAPSVITSRHILADAKTITFFFLEADAKNFPLYTKPQQITINKSDLKLIEHPDSSVDLVMIPIVSVLTYFSDKKITISYHALGDDNILKDSAAQIFRPMENVLVVGHPGGLQKELNNASLVNMGVTATPVFLDHNRKKEFLISVPSYDGAAGAPVYIYQNSNFDRNDVRMDGQRILLAGITSATYSKGFKERVYPENKMPQENVSIVIKAERIMEFKKLLIRQNK